MGILDEAIREHLDLKRAHGAEEAEVKDLESEAFGPADRPDAVSAADPSISPGSSITTPAGEGDQLDKVFKHETGTNPIPEPSSDAEKVEENDIVPAAAAEAETRIETTDAAASSIPADPDATVETPGPDVEEPAAGAPYGDSGKEDAGDMLEAERSHLSSYPTEHYDVDAAIAEEDEIDLLSESSLSDELDRALGDSPVEEVSDPEISGEAEIEDEPVMVEPEAELEPPSNEMERPEPNFDLGPESRDPKLGVEKVAEPEPEAEFEPEFEATPAVEDSDDEASGEESFFDQDDPLEDPPAHVQDDEAEDVLEETPDFLEETPEHDRLWFEQKEPKDFDFGD